MVHPSDVSLSLSTPLSPAQVDSLFCTISPSPPLCSNPFCPFRFLPQDLQRLSPLPPNPSLETSSTRKGGRTVILRVARLFIPTLKIANEVGYLAVARQAGVPIPDTISSSADTEADLVGFEYICSDFVCNPSLESVWFMLSQDALDRAVEQTADIFAQMWEADVPEGVWAGGVVEERTAGLFEGHLVEETMWGGSFNHLYPPFMTA